RRWPDHPQQRVPRRLRRAVGQPSPLDRLQALFRPAVVTRTFRTYDQRALERSMQHHAELVEAAAARDGQWAEAVMRAHILSARHATAPRQDEAPDAPLS